MTHDELVTRAVAWLRKQGHTTIITAKAIMDEEQPDAIGWKGNGFSCLVECKVSRKDFQKDAKKPWRRFPQLGMGYERYYLTPPGLVTADELPEGFGLLHTAGRGVTVAARPVAVHPDRNLRAEVVKLLSHARKLEGKVRPIRRPATGPTNKTLGQGRAGRPAVDSTKHWNIVDGG